MIFVHVEHLRENLTYHITGSRKFAITNLYVGLLHVVERLQQVVEHVLYVANIVLSIDTFIDKSHPTESRKTLCLLVVEQHLEGINEVGKFLKCICTGVNEVRDRDSCRFWIYLFLKKNDHSGR